jgi:arginyl-tRNA synthetase
MEKNIVRYIKEALSTLYNVETSGMDIPVDKTKQGIEGDFTIVVFPFVKFSKKSPKSENDARVLDKQIKQFKC